MYEFEYRRPASVPEAVEMLRDREGAKALAGGMSLLSAMKLRLASPDVLVDLGRIEGMSGIRLEGAEVRIGAMTRHAQVAASAEVGKAIPALADLAGRIGDRQVRNRGTLGGSVANADPAACYPAALLALDATVRTDRREIAADGFFTGLYETALEPGELIVSVRFRRPVQAAYEKFKQPASRLAMVGVFVARHADGVRVGVTGAKACAFRCAPIEQALTTDFSPAAAERIELPSADMASDMHAGAVYRAALVSALAATAVTRALAR
jgi:carbon-monoxide dehydrogenase medium subunit